MNDPDPHVAENRPGAGLLAVTRALSPAITECELTHLARTAIDYDLAVRQHRDYERTLEALGCWLVQAPAAPDLPDSVFVEDAAVVMEEMAVITNPGAASRRGELAGVAEVLGRFRSLVWVQEPGTLDGGDVFLVGKRMFVGRSGRTNDAGIEQLRHLLSPFRYEVCAVPLRDCLHLTTAVSPVSEDTVLLNPRWVDGTEFDGLRILEVEPSEPFAANTLRVRDALIRAEEFKRTNELLAVNGFNVVTVPASELAKAEGGVTCCSLVFEP